jgi:hypothetical protein
LSETKLSKKGIILGILILVTLLSCPVHGSLIIISHEYPLTHYTKIISEEIFTGARPVLIVLPLAGEGTTHEEFGYWKEELHTSGRWPILVFNLDNKINGNIYTEINQHANYFILN